MHDPMENIDVVWQKPSKSSPRECTVQVKRLLRTDGHTFFKENFACQDQRKANLSSTVLKCYKRVQIAQKGKTL